MTTSTIFHYLQVVISHSSFSLFVQSWQKWQFCIQRIKQQQKKVTPSGARPDVTDYYWFRSPVPNQMS